MTALAPDPKKTLALPPNYRHVTPAWFGDTTITQFSEIT